MELWIAAAAVFAAQVVKGITGFGSALVAVPVLVWLYGPQEAVFLQACLDLSAGLVLLTTLRGEIRWLLVGVVSAAVLPGQWIGTDLLLALPPGKVRLLMGAIVVALALELIARPVRAGRGEKTELPERPAPVLLQGAVAGFGGGALAGLVGAGGPPIVFFMRHHFADRMFRAQLIGIFALGAATLAPMLWWKGVGTPGLLARVVALWPALLLGLAVGTRLSGRFDRVAFGRVVGGVLLISGLALALSR